MTWMFNRPSIAGDVMQTPLLTNPLCFVVIFTERFTKHSELCGNINISTLKKKKMAHTISGYSKHFLKQHFHWSPLFPGLLQETHCLGKLQLMKQKGRRKQREKNIYLGRDTGHKRHCKPVHLSQSQNSAIFTSNI